MTDDYNKGYEVHALYGQKGGGHVKYPTITVAREAAKIVARNTKNKEAYICSWSPGDRTVRIAPGWDEIETVSIVTAKEKEAERKKDAKRYHNFRVKELKSNIEGYKFSIKSHTQNIKKLKEELKTTKNKHSTNFKLTDEKEGLKRQKLYLMQAKSELLNLKISKLKK